MSLDTHKYTNGEVSVVWKPSLFKHSWLCWKELPEVFKPTQKPWIEMDSTATERIIQQVQRCPSGALTYYMNVNEVRD
jgi:uncharacterized Fe-S cluster protein YjdI